MEPRKGTQRSNGGNRSSSHVNAVVLPLIAIPTTHSEKRNVVWTTPRSPSDEMGFSTSPRRRSFRSAKDTEESDTSHTEHNKECDSIGISPSREHIDSQYQTTEYDHDRIQIPMRPVTSYNRTNRSDPLDLSPGRETEAMALERQLKIAERRIANRDEKLSALLKDKLHWQQQVEALREQVGEEKEKYADIVSRMETFKNEATAQSESMSLSLHGMSKENEALKAEIYDLKTQLAVQSQTANEMLRHVEDEQDTLLVGMDEARNRFDLWKQNEVNLLLSQHDQVLMQLRTEYQLSVSRYEEENEKLREKVQDLEISLRLLQKDPTLSPLELRIRKDDTLASNDYTPEPNETEWIEKNARIKELEALLKHSHDVNKYQENLIEISEITISQLKHEQEQTGLDHLVRRRSLNMMTDSSTYEMVPFVPEGPPPKRQGTNAASSPARKRTTCASSTTSTPGQEHLISNTTPSIEDPTSSGAEKNDIKLAVRQFHGESPIEATRRIAVEAMNRVFADATTGFVNKQHDLLNQHRITEIPDVEAKVAAFAVKTEGGSVSNIQSTRLRSEPNRGDGQDLTAPISPPASVSEMNDSPQGSAELRVVGGFKKTIVSQSSISVSESQVDDTMGLTVGIDMESVLTSYNSTSSKTRTECADAVEMSFIRLAAQKYYSTVESHALTVVVSRVLVYVSLEAPTGDMDGRMPRCSVSRFTETQVSDKGASVPRGDPLRRESNALGNSTFMAYGVKHAYHQPFEMLDESIHSVNPRATHLLNEVPKDRKSGTASTLGNTVVAESHLVTKKKRVEADIRRRTILARNIPAFNYARVLIKFQWSDFVVATPVRNLSTASQIDVLRANGVSYSDLHRVPSNMSPCGSESNTSSDGSPIPKMKLIVKKGIKLPCSTYVIVSVFTRPLEDGNENIRIHIYDSERVDEFEYDFNEDHLRDYVENWTGSDEDIRHLFARLDFRREQDSIYIKMPEKIRHVAESVQPTTTINESAAAPTALVQMLETISLNQPVEFPPEPQYRLTTYKPTLSSSQSSSRRVSPNTSGVSRIVETPEDDGNG